MSRMNTKSPPAYSLFPNGTSADIWYSKNCDRCRNGNTGKGLPLCEIERAIELAGAMHGRLYDAESGLTTLTDAESIAARLKWDGHSYLRHNCHEFEERPA